jgi:hypothetical protein
MSSLIHDLRLFTETISLSSESAMLSFGLHQIRVAVRALDGQVDGTALALATQPLARALNFSR